MMLLLDFAVASANRKGGKKQQTRQPDQLQDWPRVPLGQQ